MGDCDGTFLTQMGTKHMSNSTTQDGGIRFSCAVFWRIFYLASDLLRLLGSQY